MDIDRVRYFNIFAETGSLVRASEVLHISQPALSKALKRLEAEVGTKLVEPDGRGLRLTAAGIQFRDQARPLLSQWMGLSKKIRDQEIWRPSRIASFEVFTTYFLGRLLRFLNHFDLEIHETSPGRMEDAVASGNVDFAITYIPVPRDGVEFIEIVRVKMGVFGLEKYRSKKFSELPFVIPLNLVEGTPSKVIGLDGWPDHLFQRKIKYRVTMMESALELCREGHAVAYLPEFVVSLHNERMLSVYRLQEFNCPISNEKRRQSVFLIRKKGIQETPQERQIAKCLRSLV